MGLYIDPCQCPIRIRNHRVSDHRYPWPSLVTNPMNIELLLWLLCVGVSGGMLVLHLLGLLDERAHLAVVLALLHLTVLCQYVLCGLYRGYIWSTRPELTEDGFFVLGVVAPVAAMAPPASTAYKRSKRTRTAEKKRPETELRGPHISEIKGKVREPTHRHIMVF
ncbi:hypothetical protein ACP4OV_029680 [Aristida adscensionis]